MSTTADDLSIAIQYTLLEPVTSPGSFQSELWTQDEFLAALTERQNRFLKASLLLVGTVPIPIDGTSGILPGQHRVTLPQDWLTTVALLWIGDDGKQVSLVRADSFEADHGLPTWVNQRGTPLMYMDEETPTLEVQIAPAPNVPGKLFLVYVPEAPDVTLGDDGATLAMPDIYALPVLKYGILAELFGKDGRGKNPEKAAYCEMRYQLGVDLSQILMNSFV